MRWTHSSQPSPAGLPTVRTSPTPQTISRSKALLNTHPSIPHNSIPLGIKQEFGPSEFLEADGWFSLETGPWLGSMSEMHSQSAVMHGDNNTSQGSCLGGFVIPSEEEAYTRAQSVFASLTLAEPNATWVYQGYPWFRVYSQVSGRVAQPAQ
eukprot:m.733761 g.733761  ORF g.733761 m.733761 type:complete len:152 (+) comp23074_c0_seq6:994-1449(+)